jgi:hypothetical protein
VRSIGIELRPVAQNSQHVIALDGHLGYVALLHRTDELAVGGLGTGPLGLVKHIEKKNHHQADYQPESQILIKWTQLRSLLNDDFEAAVNGNLAPCGRQDLNALLRAKITPSEIITHIAL